MAAPEQQGSCKSLEELIEDIGVYPAPAYKFVQDALGFTVRKIHGIASKDCEEDVSRHVTGRDLCQGAREFASKQWGLLAYTVLRRWNITRTTDLGRIVFALIDIGQMQRTENDTLDDFRDVFDLRKALEAEYTISLGS
jgi:uncharacterized repeat protein (TIGR04138 family)